MTSYGGAIPLIPCTVTGVNPPYVQVTTFSGRTYSQLVRPVLFGQAPGFHYQPALGDRLWLCFWETAYPTLICGFSAMSANPAAAMPALLAGESQWNGPTQQGMGMYQSGDIALWTPSGLVRVGSKTAARGVAASGDAISVSGSVPSGGGSVTLTGTLGAGSAALKVT